MQNNISLSVIMPALNEAESIGSAIKETLEAFETLRIEGELIVVNDGSTDATQSVIDHYINLDPRVSVVRHDKPLGIGRSFWDGKNKATREVVVYYPGDNEMIASEMMSYLHLMSQTDVVVPFMADTKVRSKTRQVLSSIYAHVVTSLLNIQVSHTNGLILYRRSVLNDFHLSTDGFMFQTELLAKVIRTGYLYAQVPYYIKPRSAGESKALSYRSIRGIINLCRHLYCLTRDVRSLPQREIVKDSATFKRREQLRSHGLIL
jgi:glycosyltransferase involved in cell wall biosynthesis